MPATELNADGATEAKATDTSRAKLHYAIKTSLSLTLAYLIPMSLGWPLPQTAAITVMLIAATGMVSESLQKGVSRVLGTIVGAAIGLSLIAMFPQDRMNYLLAVSCTAAIIIYLYNAYQGDSTVFMLTAVVTLMVFNGGDAEGAFLYGVDRAFMTAFGVIIYTVVASMLWPVKSANNTRALAADLAGKYRQAFDRLVRTGAGQAESHAEDFLAVLLENATSFQTQFSSAKNHAEGVTDYLPEWNVVVRGYEDLENLLLPALRQNERQSVEFGDYIDNYSLVLGRVDALFEAVDAAWQGQPHSSTYEALKIELNGQNLRQGKHLTAAAVITRAELLQDIQAILLELLAALESLLFDKGKVVVNRVPRGKPAFNWLELENLKTALRAFFTFWIATAIWIAWNPPGGFMFVTLCTVLVPLVSYTPATPKLLFILFTLGFLFALPAYVFLLPQLTHWLELGLFLFSYAFIGFYIFQGPVSIFFLLGLFTLGIQNTMNYHVDAILLSITMFYMICATLIISTHLPFSSKPERIYRSLRRRFFNHCSRWLISLSAPPTWGNRLSRLFLGNCEPLLARMISLGPQIDSSLLPERSRQHLTGLNNACEVLHGQLQVLASRNNSFNKNPLIIATRRRNKLNVLATLCSSLADSFLPEELVSIRANIANIEKQLDELLGDDYLDRYDAKELAQFYIYLNLQASIFDSIESCSKALEALDWQRLGETRF